MRRARLLPLLAGGFAIVFTAAGSASAADTGNLAHLRQRALELVNRDRTERNLSSLDPGEDLNEAALAHARDMLRRNFYAHESPEGDTVQDRYIEAGGSRWRLVAENIARCAECDPPPTTDTVERLHRGWMNSPGHRANILARGLDRFGYALVVDADQGLYAVQTFAGPGMPRGLQPGEQTSALSPEEQAAHALRAINRIREREGVAPLEGSPALSAAARRLIPAEDAPFRLSGNILAALPGAGRSQWRAVSAVAGACGGCGTQPTAADVRSFRQQWLNDPQYRQTLLDPAFTHLGFALAATGEGRKIAVAVLGRI